MHFTSFLFKNLLRRPARSMLTIVGLAVAVGAVVSLVGVATGFENSFLKVYATREVDLVVQRAGGEESINNGLPESLLKPIAETKGVKEVVGGSLDMISFPEQNLEGVLLNGWMAESSLFSRVEIIKGRRLQAGDARKIMIGRVLAANLDKKVGDTVDLYDSVPFEVVGIYESPIVFENGGAVILLDQLQDQMNRHGEITGFTITAEKPIDAKGMEELRKRIAALDPGNLEVTPSTEFVQGVQQIRIAKSVSWLTSAIALVIGAIGMLNTMIMSVFERTKEIGTLRAIGWRRSRIIRMVIGESVLLSIGGAILGSLAGILLVRVLTQLRIASGFVSGDIAPAVILQGFIVALVVGVLGAIYPALWSANLLPTEALRRK